RGGGGGGGGRAGGYGFCACHCASAGVGILKLVTILATVSATWGRWYSSGTRQPLGSFVASSTAAAIASGSEPAMRFDPHSTVSGRSVTSRIVTFGIPKMHASSCTVPLSDRM